jgi:hypothetical protein
MPPLPRQTKGGRIEQRTEEDLNHLPDGTPFSAGTLVRRRRRGEDDEWKHLPPPPLSKRELLMRLFKKGSFMSGDGISFVIQLVTTMILSGKWLPPEWNPYERHSLLQGWPKDSFGCGFLLPVPELSDANLPPYYADYAADDSFIACPMSCSECQHRKGWIVLAKLVRAEKLGFILFMHIANLVLRIKRSDAKHALDVAEQDAQNEESSIQRSFSKTDEEDDISYNRLLRYS